MKKILTILSVLSMPLVAAHGPELIHAVEEHPVKALIDLAVSLVLTAIAIVVIHRIAKRTTKK